MRVGLSSGRLRFSPAPDCPIARPASAVIRTAYSQARTFITYQVLSIAVAAGFRTTVLFTAARHEIATLSRESGKT